MKAKSTTQTSQSVREALQVLRQAEISRQAIIVDQNNNLVYAKAAPHQKAGPAAAAGSDAIQRLHGKIEMELSRFARSLSEVRESLIPKYLPSLALVTSPHTTTRLTAIEKLATEWHDFVKTREVTAHQEWQQTMVRRQNFCDWIGDGMPLGLKCSPEDGMVTATTLKLKGTDVLQLQHKLVDSAHRQIDEMHGISLQTIKDAPRTDSIRLALPAMEGDMSSPTTLELKRPKAEELSTALQTLYERLHAVSGDGSASQRPVQGAPEDKNRILWQQFPCC